MALPQHPGHDDDTPTGRAMSRATKVWIALGASLVLVVIVLHLSGVIGGGH
jgi:hypothetical protein